jgi:hypothetical protein
MEREVGSPPIARVKNSFGVSPVEILDEQLQEVLPRSRRLGGVAWPAGD